MSTSNKWYGQTISTADNRPYVVQEREFETLAEAKAYAMGVDDGIAEGDPDCDSVHGATSSQPAEDEP
jgi:hypothetical protein